MRILLLGLGAQGRKRLDIAQKEVISTVDPVHPEADYKTINEVPLDSFDAAFVCTPDQEKIRLLSFLLSRGKHTLVEKPLLAANVSQLEDLSDLSRSNDAVCYTAYNHRFEPHIIRLADLVKKETIGKLFYARFFYGNGTAVNVKSSPWRDANYGVVSDLGSHLLDLTRFIFKDNSIEYEAWSIQNFENRASDHFVIGGKGNLIIQLEGSLVSWRNTFTIDVYGELGSVHIDGLCKWGPSRMTVRNRIYPSGIPTEEEQVVAMADPTWSSEYEHFKDLCHHGSTNLENDVWINSVITNVVDGSGCLE